MTLSSLRGVTDIGGVLVQEYNEKSDHEEL